MNHLNRPDMSYQLKMDQNVITNRTLLLKFPERVIG